MFTFSKYADPHYEGEEFVPGYISQANMVLQGKVSRLTDEEANSPTGQAEIKAVREKALRILKNSMRRA